MKGRGKAADVSAFERDSLLFSFRFWEKIGLERVISEWTFLIMSTKTNVSPGITFCWFSCMYQQLVRD